MHKLPKANKTGDLVFNFGCLDKYLKRITSAVWFSAQPDEGFGRKKEEYPSKA